MNTRKVLVAAAVVVLVAAGGVGAWALRTSARRAGAVAATVNGEAILWSQVDAEVTRAAAQFGVDPKSAEFTRQRDEISKAVVDQLITTRIVIQEARRRNVVVSDSQVDEQIADIKKRFPAEKEFTTALSRAGFTLASLREMVRTNLSQRQVAAAVAQTSVADDEVRRQFDANRAQYDQPAQIRVSHILFRVPDKDQESLARAKAKIVEAKLSDGAAFEDMAKQYSDDPGSAQRGGDLGFVARGSLVKEFEEVAWALKPGQTSEPVRTQYGLHIIRVHEVKEARKATFELVKDQIREQLQSGKRDKAFEAWLEAQRKTAKIEKFDRR